MCQSDNLKNYNQIGLYNNWQHPPHSHLHSRRVHSEKDYLKIKKNGLITDHTLKF